MPADADHETFIHSVPWFRRLIGDRAIRAILVPEERMEEFETAFPEATIYPNFWFYRGYPEASAAS